MSWCKRRFPGLHARDARSDDVGNGWHSTGNRDGFGDDYKFRPIANFGGIWWNSATEVIYYPLQSDQTGMPPTGDHTYALRFAPGESPGEHVDGYWSITLYSHPEVRLVPNPVGQVLDQLPQRSRFDPDGGFTVRIAPARPDGVTDSNWLPSTGPGEPWVLVMRLYLPRQDVLDGGWTPPPMITQT